MIQLSTLVVVLAGELFLTLVIALATLLLMAARRRRRDRQAALHLAGHIRDSEPQRLTEVRDLLLNAYRYSEARAEQTAHALLRAEKRLYQRMLNIYISRDALALRQLHIQMDDLTGAFRGLEVPKGGASEDDLATGTASDELLQRLRKENEGLKQELQVTMETMGRMLSEYASMFNTGGANAQIPGEILGGAGGQEDDLATIQELEIPGLAGGAIDEFDDLGPLWGERHQDDPLAKTLILPQGQRAPAGDVDLSAPDLDDLFAEANAQVGQKGASEPENSVDLDDIWADALAEQESAHVDSKSSKKLP